MCVCGFRPDAVERGSGDTVAALGHPGVHPGGCECGQLRAARRPALQDGQGEVPQACSTLHGRHSVGAPRHTAKRWVTCFLLPSYTGVEYWGSIQSFSYLL